MLDDPMEMSQSPEGLAGNFHVTQVNDTMVDALWSLNPPKGSPAISTE